MASWGCSVTVVDRGGDPASGTTAGTPTPFDFRRTSKFGREEIRRLEVAHELFSRRVASGWGGALRSLVQLEPLAVNQVSYDDYIRSMPNPSILATVGLPPLPGAVVIEVNAQLALVLVDRLLGGGGPGAAARFRDIRRPTQLESALLGDLMRHPVAALEETLGPLTATTAELNSMEHNPQLVQLAAPSETVVLLSYRMTVTHGAQAEGLVSVCYPAPTLVPLLEQLTSQSRADEAAEVTDAQARDSVRAGLDGVDVVLRVELNPTAMAAHELAGLRVGDVLRLDHPVHEPATGRIEGTPVLAGHLCRRRQRLALQVGPWVHEPRIEAPPLQPRNDP